MPEQAQSTQQPPGAHHPLATWLAFNRDYVTGKGTIRELALKYNIPEETAWNKHREYKLGRLRAKYFARERAKLEALTDAPPEPEPKPDTGVRLNEGNGEDKVRLQIEAIDKLFDEATEASDLVKLADAKAKLWSLLYPKPGVKRTPRRSYPPVQNPDPTPTPSQPPTLG